MLCCICKEREATVHLTQIAGEKIQKVDLCEECAKEKGVNDPAAFSLADLLLGLGAAQEVEQATGEQESACPACGFTHADFKKTGRLGCPTCYEHFADGLTALLKSMHKGVRHVGKVPTRFKQRKQASDTSDRLKNLQRELAKAIHEEKFERAAELRDEIKALSAPQPEPGARA
jgi:protein arginine kinase activator